MEITILSLKAINAILFTYFYPILSIIGLLFVCFLTGMYFCSRRKSLSANEWMLQLLKSMPDMAVIIDSNLIIFRIINPLENVLLGLDPKQLPGTSIRDLGKQNTTFASVAGRIAAQVEDTLLTQNSNTFEYEVKKDNITCYTMVRIVPFINGQVICFCHDQTEYITAKKKSTELQSIFQAIVNNIPVGLLVKNISNDLRYVFFNNHLLDFFGNDQSFELGQNDIDRPEEMTDTFVQEDQLVIASNKPISFERVFYNEETGLPERWAITTKNCFTGQDGTPYLMATTVETTDTKKKDFELRKTQNELSLALEAGNTSAWYLDVRTMVYYSLSGETLSDNGLAFEDFVNKILPEDRDKIRMMTNRLITGKSKKEKLAVRIPVDGKIEWYESYAIGVKSEKDGKVYQVVGTECNITENITKQKDLEIAKSKLELAFTSAQIVPWELDLNTRRFSSVNNNEIESKNILLEEYSNYAHPDDIQTMVEGFESILNGKKNAMTIQVRMAFPGKEQRWYELHAVIPEKGKNEYSKRLLIGLRRDITVVKTTDELIELRNKAEHSNRLKSAFLANMSHEIRTPLNAIVGFSQLIMQTDDQEEKENYAQIIETNNDLLLQLISDILDLSKIEADEMDFVFSEFNVSTIFNNLEKIYSLKVKPEVKLVTRLPEQNYTILSEKNRLTQVVSNFLSNAIKFTSRGNITMGYEPVENGLRFFVKDTGKGISPENLSDVFTRFSKFDNFVQGTGLGLSISKHIVEYLEGEINVSSQLGKGTEFWFQIPCEPLLIEK